MTERAKVSIDNLEFVNPKLYANYIKYSDEKKAEEFTRQINREKAKTALNAYLRNPKWNVIIREDLLRIDNKTCTLFRNKIVHLEVARYAHRYIYDISEINSYFKLYHYIIQRIIIDEIYDKSSGKIREYYDAVNKDMKFNDRLLKLLCVPFGYCIPRFKNLSIEALFDRNEAAKFDTAIWFLYINKPFRRIIKHADRTAFSAEFYSVQTVYYTADDWRDMAINKIYYTECNGASVPVVVKNLIRVDNEGFVGTIEPLTVEDYSMLLKSWWLTKRKDPIGAVINYLRSEHTFRYVRPETIEDSFDGIPPTWDELTDL